MERFRVELSPLANAEAIEGAWHHLSTVTNASAFLSWAWIGPWLAASRPRFDVSVAQVTEGEETVGLCALTRRRIKRRGVIVSNVLYVNEWGPSDTSLCIEYNDLLLGPGREQPAMRALLGELLKDRTWDEIQLRRTTPDSPVLGVWEAELRGLGLTMEVLKSAPSHYVDLDEIRKAGKGYLAALSANRRGQIRRALRSWQIHGEPTVREASDPREALEFFDAMVTLHTRYWNEKGKPGSFATQAALDFHRHIIAQGQENGAVQLLKVAAGKQVLGYIYNMVHDGYVYMYQSGFDYSVAPECRPGEIAHYLAIEHNLALGNRAYDFLAGDARYKKSLSTDSREMVWVTIRRPRLKFIAEEWIAAGWGKVKSTLKR